VATLEGRVLRQPKAKDFGQAVSRGAADEVAGMMVDVVEKGTGRVAGISGVTVAGKTGSAQLAKGPANGWFTCFAPAGEGEKPQAVVTVIVEGGESGSGSAGPIARRVLEQLLEDREKR
jgi:peptidoglycan glycosyltransferase